MPSKVSEQKAGAPLEAILASVAARVSERIPRADGSIVVRCTDTEDEYIVDGVGARVQVGRRAGRAQPLVQVSGPSTVLRAVLSGELEASKAFARGEIRAKGDLAYLEAVLKDLGLLQCE